VINFFSVSKITWYVFLVGGMILITFSNGAFLNKAKSADLGDTIIEAGKTVCVSKDIVMDELIDLAYDRVPEEGKVIFDKFKAGEELTECDYFEIYKILNKKNIKSWILDESCNALVCSGI
jgi:hypothetical protein